MNNEPAYVNAAHDAGASQYWTGYRKIKQQTHPKRSPKESGIHIIEKDARLKNLEQRQDHLESSITEVKSTQEDTKQEMTTLRNKVVCWQESTPSASSSLNHLRKSHDRFRGDLLS